MLGRSVVQSCSLPLVPLNGLCSFMPMGKSAGFQQCVCVCVCVCPQMAADSCNLPNILRIFLRVCISSPWLLLHITTMWVPYRASPAIQQWTICLQCRRLGFYFWVRKILWRRAWQSTPVFTPGEFQWLEKIGGLLSFRLQRVKHDWSNEQKLFSYISEAWKSKIKMSVELYSPLKL